MHEISAVMIEAHSRRVDRPRLPKAVEADRKARIAEVSVCGRTEAGRKGKQPCDCHRKMESYLNVLCIRGAAFVYIIVHG